MPNQVIHIFTTVADRFFELQKLGLAGYSGLSRRTTSCPIRVTTRIFRTSLLFGLFFLPPPGPKNRSATAFGSNSKLRHIRTYQVAEQRVQIPDTVNIGHRGFKQQFR